MTSVRMTISGWMCFYFAAFSSQIMLAQSGHHRQDMSSVTEALEYVQEIASLGEGNCTFGPTLNLEYDTERWVNEAVVAVRSANLLTSLWRVGDHMFGSGEQDEQLPYAIVMSNVDNNPNVFGSAIAFGHWLYRDYEIFCPYAFRASFGTEVKDLSIGYNYLDNSTDWFYIPLMNFQNESRDFNFTYYHHRPDSNATPSARLALGDGYWTKPYYDCGGANVWVVTFSMPFFLPAQQDLAYLSADSPPETLKFAGVTTIDVALSSLDINQCPRNSSAADSQNVFDPFVDTHLCKNTTYCSPISGRGFERGAYMCNCRKGYYFPDKTNPHQAFNGSEVENEFSKMVRGYPNIYHSGFHCLRCMKGCDECVNDTPCFLEPSAVLRIAALAVTSTCLLVLPFLGIFTWMNRENKVFKAASPGLLYVFLLGSAIMYTEIVLHAALRGTSASWYCVLQPWARYLGIAMAYGALLFKTWRITVVFTVRSAKPVRITDTSLYLRIGVLVVLMAIFLGVGTYLQPSTIETRVTSANMKYKQCTITTWSYVGEGAALLLLAWGVYLCVKVRKAPSAFNECKFISICIYNETLVSAFNIILTTVVLKSVEQNVADKQFIVGVCRVHLTVTTMVALLYGSKIYHIMQTKKQTASSKLDLKKRNKGPRGPMGMYGTTLDSISHSIDFCYTNPDVKSEVQRMEKILESIKEALTLQDDGKMQASLSHFDKELKGPVSQRSVCSRDGEDDVPGPSRYTAAHHQRVSTIADENWILK